MKNKSRTRNTREITPKSLGLVDDVKLSKSYANSRTNFKTVSDVILGYYLAGDGSRAPIRIAPIYRADIWFRDRKDRGANQIIASHEIGAYYNPQRRDAEEPDTDGDALAYLAATALSALERHARREQVKVEAPKEKRKPQKRRGT